jgi:hypothetical protein
MVKKSMAHPDAAEDKKMFSGMLKKAMGGKKVAQHLKADIKEQKHGIKKDVGLMKSLKKGY